MCAIAHGDIETVRLTQDLTNDGAVVDRKSFKFVKKSFKFVLILLYKSKNGQILFQTSPFCAHLMEINIFFYICISLDQESRSGSMTIFF